MASTLSSLNFLTQRITHAKTNHTFVVYLSSDNESCTIDLTIAGPDGDDPDFNVELLGRWWSATLSSSDLMDLTPVEDVTSATLAGELYIRGWSVAKAKTSDVDIKLVLNSPNSKMRFELGECSPTAALLRQKSLLLKMTEKAQENDCRLFGGASGQPQVIKLQSELDGLLRQLKKRDHMIDDLKSQLDVANVHLKEYIKDAAPSRPVPIGPKFPANHGKASVTKKRRLVQKLEYED